MTLRTTRAQHLGALIFDALAQSRTGWREYTAAVVDHYHDTVPRDERVVEFQVAATAERYEAVARNNTQTVRRYVAGERVLVADLEESLVAALPEPWRERVLAALLARSGLMYARTPPAVTDGVGQVRTSADLMRRAATAMDRLAPMLDDQRIGPEDRAHFPEALQAINGVMGACVTLNAQIAAAMQATAPGRVAGRQSRDTH